MNGPELNIDDLPDLLMPAEMGALFRVDTETVSGWARRGWVHPIVTPNGHRRYFREEARMILAGHQVTKQTAAALRELWIGKALPS